MSIERDRRAEFSGIESDIGSTWKGLMALQRCGGMLVEGGQVQRRIETGVPRSDRRLFPDPVGNAYGVMLVQHGVSALNLHLTIDRFEGDRKQLAVLLTDDGTQINFPRKLLPKGVRAGEVLSFKIEHDVEATKQVAEQTRAVQEQLKKTDPGGDLKL
jgi:hypothetical protein